MNTSQVNFDFWLFLAGLGIFLFGMYHLEKGINGLAGKSFKKVIKNFTDTPFKGILTGTFSSSILQSSSLVTLLTAAFLGGGVIKLQNAISVVLGANIGTTSTAWIVAFLGFKLNISSFSYPFLAIGTLSYLFMDNRPVLKALGSFFIGFGLIFLGIDFLKESVETLTQEINLKEYANLGLWVFVVIGIIVTAMIHSSSAIMIIVLTALYGNLIDVYQACAITIGANIGTTITLVLAGIKGTADKKRLAISHVFFNVITGIVAFVFLYPLMEMMIDILKLSDPVLQISAFNTVLNVLGVILFYPFIIPFSKKLQSYFIDKNEDTNCMYINKVSTEVTDVALTALDQEIKNVFLMTREFVVEVLRLKEDTKEKGTTFTKILEKEDNPLEKYNLLKKTEDEVTSFFKQLQLKRLTVAESNLLAAHMIRLRSLVYAAKNMKDIISNVKDMEESDDVLSKKLLKKIRLFALEKIEEFTLHISSENKQDLNARWHHEIDIFYHKSIDYLYDQLIENEPPSISVSTMTNVIKKTVSCLEEMSNAATDEENIHESITEIYS